MADESWSSGGGPSHSTGFLGLEPKHLTAIIIAVVLAVSILGAALLLRGGSSSPPRDPEIACLEGGGTWNKLFGTCSH